MVRKTHSLILSFLYLKLTVVIKFQIIWYTLQREKKIFLIHKELILPAGAIFEYILALQDFTPIRLELEGCFRKINDNHGQLDQYVLDFFPLAGTGQSAANAAANTNILRAKVL